MLPSLTQWICPYLYVPPVYRISHQYRKRARRRIPNRVVRKHEGEGGEIRQGDALSGKPGWRRNASQQREMVSLTALLCERPRSRQYEQRSCHHHRPRSEPASASGSHPPLRTRGRLARHFCSQSDPTSHPCSRKRISGAGTPAAVSARCSQARIAQTALQPRRSISPKVPKLPTPRGPFRF